MSKLFYVASDDGRAVYRSKSTKLLYVRNFGDIAPGMELCQYKTKDKAQDLAMITAVNGWEGFSVKEL